MPLLVKQLFLVAMGGALGASSRYLVTLASARWIGTAFPWGTLMVNLIGCFLYGLIFALLAKEWAWSLEARLFLLTGFLGGLTTFSSFGAETVLLGADGSGMAAMLNVAANNAAGMGLVLLGLWIGKLF